MIKRKQRLSLTEREAAYLERHAALEARREALRANKEMAKVDRAQRLAELAVEFADFETELDQWRNVRAMEEAQERATEAGTYAEDVVAETSDA